MNQSLASVSQWAIGSVTMHTISATTPPHPHPTPQHLCSVKDLAQNIKPILHPPAHLYFLKERCIMSSAHLFISQVHSVSRGDTRGYDKTFLSEAHEATLTFSRSLQILRLSHFVRFYITFRIDCFLTFI